jgi:hypothetical protein
MNHLYSVKVKKAWGTTSTHNFIWQALYLAMTQFTYRFRRLDCINIIYTRCNTCRPTTVWSAQNCSITLQYCTFTKKKYAVTQNTIPVTSETVYTHLNYLRFQVLTAESMMFRIVFWDVLPCIPEDNSELKLFVRQQYLLVFILRSYTQQSCCLRYNYIYSDIK